MEDAESNLTADTIEAQALLGFVEAINGAEVQVFSADKQTEKTGTTTVAATDIIVVTAANGTTTQDYTIEFGE